MRISKIALWLLAGAAAFAQPHHWTEAEANDWYGRQPFLVGSNFIPSTASNQLEMWQAETFDPVTIDRELGWAQQLGMNTMRVFLHDLLWLRDSSGFEKRINAFLKIADKHRIRPIFVLFDSCWDPFPEYGPQLAPRPGIHNSRWVQSPGAGALMDPKQSERLLGYVQAIIADYAHDKRILAWDLWNEPDNKSGNYKADATNKTALVAAFLPKVFTYARAAIPDQPLTSGLWQGDWSSPEKLSAVEKIQIENSDVISFHNYDKPEDFEKHVVWLEAWHRPILCTEYMARPRGSTFQTILPIARKHHVAAINWGFVAGKTQTYLPWDSWEHPYVDKQPDVWFHDIFHPNGAPYSMAEVEAIRAATEWSPDKGKTSKTKHK
jgi:hypothetical protein